MKNSERYCYWIKDNETAQDYLKGYMFEHLKTLKKREEFIRTFKEKEITIIYRFNWDFIPFFYIYYDNTAYIGNKYTILDGAILLIIKLRAKYKKEKNFQKTDWLRDVLKKSEFQIYDNIKKEEIFWLDV